MIDSEREATEYMAKKKTKKKKTVAAGKQKKIVAKKSKKIVKMAKKKPVAKKKAVAKTKPVAKKKAAPKKAAARQVRGKSNEVELVSYQRRGLAADTGGQSGDTQGLSGRVDVDSESVKELLEEGQAYEAEAVKGVEDAADPDVAEVHTRQVPEDDVPREYDDQ
jgi:hypothetical protein